MNKIKTCLGIVGDFDIPDEKQIEMFRLAGFSAFFVGWNHRAQKDGWIRGAKENDMIFQSVHAPFGMCRDLWHADDETAARGVEELKNCVRGCAELNVPIMVSHAFIGFEDHTPTQKGIERFGEVVKEAEKEGVKIAFENTEGEEYLAEIFRNFGSSPNVGFCWDSGHELCYNVRTDMLALYGDKLLATHLNDNMGVSDENGKITFLDDLHLLPFDGIADWKNNAERLKKSRMPEILTFELKVESKPGHHENDKYGAMPPAQYIAEAYSRAVHVTELL